MSIAVRILSPGAQTTVQDLGRAGQRHFGAPQGGAADPLSLALANAAAGNPACASALECALSGPALEFTKQTVFALGGADMEARLNDAPVALYEPYTAEPGARLALAGVKTGMRAYIALRGGLIADTFLDSASTYLPAGLGGHQGRALEAGDTLALGGLATRPPALIPPSYRPVFGHDWVLRAAPGPEIELITQKERRALFAEPFIAARRGDRMGVQLKGPALSPRLDASMASGAVYPGTVQCPPDGAPFLLLSDGQTTGGYPRLLQVCAADLSLTGQIRPGDKVWFREISIDGALDLLKRKTALYSGLLPGFSFG